MDQLKSYLKPLSKHDREEFAVSCGTTLGHLTNVGNGFRPCATDLAVSIERRSGFKVRRWDLRPDDWWKHWPELIGAAGAPAVPQQPAGPQPA